MRHQTHAALVGALLMLGACGALDGGGGDEDCVAGTVDCPCSEQGCVGALECVEERCLDPDEVGSDSGLGDGASSDSDTSDSDTSDSDTSDSDTSDSDTSDPTTSPSGPRIVDFGANITQITEGESVIFSATVIDPDGPEDIQGGSLKSADGTIIYRPFEDIGNGTFGVSLSWAELHLTSSIEFSEPQVRGLRADFFDNSGNQDSQSIELTLSCDDPLKTQACDGECVSLADDDNNCGACGSTCDVGASCTAGTCLVAWGECLGLDAEVSTCAEYCAGLEEVCSTGCGTAGLSVSLWVDPRCVGPADFTESSAAACTLEPPDTLSSAQCCCTSGAVFP